MRSGVRADNFEVKMSTAFARCLLMSAAIIALLPVAFAQSTHFFVLDNPGDPNFNQLLGVNNADMIVGYFGDGTVVPNSAYLLVPKNHYSMDHIPSGVTQTQAIGVNNTSFPDIVGFFTDSNGLSHGFLDANGSEARIDDPAGAPPNVTKTVQNLLGINDSGDAVGFWTDNNGHEHGFGVILDTQTLTALTFFEISPSTFSGAVATQASDINNADDVCGFWTDASGNNHGFFGHAGLTPAAINVSIPGVTAVSTSPFGCNDKGEIVGSFTDSKGNIHGFLFVGGKYTQYDAQGSSQTPAFGVMGTFINGVNNNGDIVGFFSDGTKVHGFLDFAAK